MESDHVPVRARSERNLSLKENYARLPSGAVLIACLALGCSRDSNSECIDLAEDAWVAIESVDGQHQECLVDSDCGAVPIPTGCWQAPTCTAFFIGNKASLEAALGDAANGVARNLCERFESQRCIYPDPPSCDLAAEPRLFQCSQNKCVSTTSSSPVVGSDGRNH